MPRIVLFQPQIPPNTGNVARTCAATGQELHLIEPLGFCLDDRHLRRAGLDYWPLVKLCLHPDIKAFLAMRHDKGGRLLAFSSHAKKAYTATRYRSEDWLLFGRECDGLPPGLMELADEQLTIPMAHSIHARSGGVRSLNLSVAVGVVLFEALRQSDEADCG